MAYPVRRDDTEATLSAEHKLVLWCAETIVEMRDIHNRHERRIQQLKSQNKRLQSRLIEERRDRWSLPKRLPVTRVVSVLLWRHVWSMCWLWLMLMIGGLTRNPLPWLMVALVVNTIYVAIVVLAASGHRTWGLGYYYCSVAWQRLLARCCVPCLACEECRWQDGCRLGRAMACLGMRCRLRLCDWDACYHGWRAYVAACRAWTCCSCRRDRIRYSRLR